MGLSFRPEDASWSYNGYADLRHRLALWEGIDLDEMKGFGGSVDWGDVVTALEPLLNSSDVHGFFTSSQCKQMIPRLVAILRDYDMSDYDRSNLSALVRGMQHCVQHGCAMSWG